MEDPVRRHASERPVALALRTEEGDLSYAALDAAADRAARALAAAGVARGDRVATTLPPGPGFAALLHATPRLGATLVPLPPRAPDSERERLLELAAPRLLVATPLGKWEDVDASADVRSGGAGARPELEPSAPHTLLFTSGTTGAPKPVALTLANHVASARASASNLGVDPGDRWLCVLPTHHVGGLAILMRSALYGTAAIVHERFEVGAVKGSLESGEATLVSLVATQLRRLAEAGLERAPALRAVLVGGGRVPIDLLRYAEERGLPVRATYGMTETASQIVTMPAGEALAHASRGAAGRPLEGVELRVAGDIGEILVRGPSVAAGALAPDGWLHTGDRGHLDADGLLWVDGRLDDTIVTGGENVAAAEVEAALALHPAVREVAVVGRPDSEWGQAVTAYVVVGEGAAPTDAELVAHCRARLAPHKAPKSIHRLSRLPRTDSGKVARARLLDAERSG